MGSRAQAVVVIDAKDFVVINNIALTHRASSIDIPSNGQEAYATGSNVLSVIDTKTLSVITTIQGVNGRRIGVNTNGHLAITTGGGNATLIDLVNRIILQSVNLGGGTWGVAFLNGPQRGTPPPCVATTGAEYVISGGPDPGAEIFVDDILRVFVNAGLVAEVSQGGRCCPPVAPIRFVADTGDILRVQAQDANDCYSLEALWLQKADGSCLTQLTGDIFGPNCGSEPPEQIFFDQNFTLP